MMIFYLDLRWTKGFQPEPLNTIPEPEKAAPPPRKDIPLAFFLRLRFFRPPPRKDIPLPAFPDLPYPFQVTPDRYVPPEPRFFLLTFRLHPHGMFYSTKENMTKGPKRPQSISYAWLAKKKT